VTAIRHPFAALPSRNCAPVVSTWISMKKKCCRYEASLYEDGVPIERTLGRSFYHFIGTAMHLLRLRWNNRRG
jgi:hypothetical protein